MGQDRGQEEEMRRGVKGGKEVNRSTNEHFLINWGTFLLCCEHAEYGQKPPPPVTMYFMCVSFVLMAALILTLNPELYPFSPSSCRQTQWMDRQMCTDREGESRIRSTREMGKGSRTHKVSKNQV